MPHTWWGKALTWTYVAGYFGYILLAAVFTWGTMPFMTWWNYVGWQSIYGVAWPVFLVRSILTLLA